MRMADQYSRRELLRYAGLAAGALGVGSLVGTTAHAAPLSAPPFTGDPIRIRAAGGSLGSAGVTRQALKLAGEELGVADVEIQHMAQSTALLSVRDGSMDTAMFSWANFGQAAEAGIDMLAIAPAWASHASILVPADSEIEALDQLLGKKVGGPARTSGTYSETRAVLAQQGIGVEDDFSFTVLGDTAVLLGLYRQGEFDAIVTNEPGVSIELDEGTSRELIQIGQYQADHNEGRFMPVNSWGIRREWADEYGSAMLHELFSRATEIAKTSSDPYEMAQEDSGMTDSATELFYERFSKLLVTEFDDQNLADAQELMDTALELDLVKEEHDVTDFAYRGE